MADVCETRYGFVVPQLVPKKKAMHLELAFDWTHATNIIKLHLDRLEDIIKNMNQKISKIEIGSNVMRSN